MNPNLISLLNIAISIFIAIGGLAAFRYGFKRTISEVQERVINALETELNDIRVQLTEVRAENIRLNHTLNTIIDALAKSGIYITIQGDMINIENSRDGSFHAVRITEVQ